MTKKSRYTSSDPTKRQKQLSNLLRGRPKQYHKPKFINKAGNGMTKAFADYALPLVGDLPVIGKLP